MPKFSSWFCIDLPGMYLEDIFTVWAEQDAAWGRVLNGSSTLLRNVWNALHQPLSPPVVLEVIWMYKPRSLRCIKIQHCELWEATCSMRSPQILSLNKTAWPRNLSIAPEPYSVHTVEPWNYWTWGWRVAREHLRWNMLVFFFLFWSELFVWKEKRGRKRGRLIR